MNYHKGFDSLYCICEGEIKKETTKHYEGVFAQGSGYMHMRGSYEEGLTDAFQNGEYMRLPANVTIEKPRNPRSKWGTYIPGITGIHPILKEEIINLPYMLSFKVFANGTELDMEKCTIDRYKRTLDMRDGLLYREFDWTLDSGATLRCFYTRYISRARKNLIVQDMSFTATNGMCNIVFISDIDENVKTNGYNHYTSIEKRLKNNQVDLKLLTDNNDEVIMSSRAFSSKLTFSPNGNAAMGAIILHENENVLIHKLSCAITSRDNDVKFFNNEVNNQLDEAEKNINELYFAHDAVWREMWNNAELNIEGDDRAQLAVNFSIYHLLRSANPNDSRVAVCAKGYSGEAYFGHFFWDTEVYLLPFFLYTNPETASALTEFRINTLDGAKRNAAHYGYKGARYAWESSLLGVEQCPNWQYADHEVHITADVTYGLWHYYKATMDNDFLVKAFPVFMQTAKYWLSRVERKNDGTINLNGVMGPDEYICICNNNAYTNYMVSYSLKRTIEVAQLVKDIDYEVYKALGITEEELEQFRIVAEGLPVASIDNGVILQCDGFEDFEEIDFETIWIDRSKPFGHCISQERNYRSKALKQADVLMLPYLFPSCFTKKQAEVNYDYYYPYTTHDSSLSSIIHAILCCMLDRPEEAYDLFCKSLDVDLSEQKAGAAEGIHIANCGGIWQAIIFGFAGMSWSYESDELKFTPKLPEKWKSLRFKIIYKGKHYRVAIDKNGTNMERDG
jgi:trehalose/maltose hydrolase-like predicted phosphorylase